MRSRRWGLALCVAGLAASGCGGGGGASDDGGDAASAKADYVSRADAVCRKATAERQTVVVPGMRVEGPRRNAKIALYASRVKPVYLRALASLRALHPPAADRARLDAMLGTFDGAFALIDPLVAAARADSEEEGASLYFSWVETARRAGDLAAAYGLKDCSTFGLP
jgi:hypothetical protein